MADFTIGGTLYSIPPLKFKWARLAFEPLTRAASADVSATKPDGSIRTPAELASMVARANLESAAAILEVVSIGLDQKRTLAIKEARRNAAAAELTAAEAMVVPTGLELQEDLMPDEVGPMLAGLEILMVESGMAVSGETPPAPDADPAPASPSTETSNPSSSNSSPPA